MANKLKVVVYEKNNKLTHITFSYYSNYKKWVELHNPKIIYSFILDKNKIVKKESIKKEESVNQSIASEMMETSYADAWEDSFYGY